MTEIRRLILRLNTSLNVTNDLILVILHQTKKLEYFDVVNFKINKNVLFSWRQVHGQCFLIGKPVNKLSIKVGENLAILLNLELKVKGHKHQGTR